MLLISVTNSNKSKANGENWKKQRNIASHMFTVRALKDCMFETFDSTMDRLLEKFEELKQTQSSINMYDMWNRLTFEAFTKIAFGMVSFCPFSSYLIVNAIDTKALR